MSNTNYKSKYTGQQVDQAVSDVQDIISGKKSVTADSLNLDLSRFESNIITEEGLYCIHCAMPEEQLTALMYLDGTRTHSYEQSGYRLEFDPFVTPQLQIYYEDNSRVSDAVFTIYQIARV